MTVARTIEDAGAALRQGDLTSLELTEAALDRIEKLDPRLGAFLAVNAAGARIQARQADASFAAGLDRGPLQGIPFGLKDILATADQATTANSLILDPAWGDGIDAVVTERVRASGAVIAGKLVLSEFAIGAPDDTKPFPIPRNPWATDHTPGGSCSSGAYAVELAAQHIRSGQSDVMVVVGGEAFDTAVRLEWFRRLELYAQEGCMRPFDTEPRGFYVGEGAAAIVLESAEHAASRGAEPYARYLGGAFAHQGWKQTIPDVRSARLAGVICDALAIAGCTAADVDLIVPHGAATGLSDGYEAYCVEQGIGAQLRTDASDGAVATAFKPYVGHMLAASGIIDTLCALLAMRHRSIPATLHTRPDRVRFPAPLVTTRLDRQVKTLLKLFTGFTGHDAALVFRGL